MALQFILGGSGSGKSKMVQDMAIELSKDRNNSILMVVPDQFTMQTQWQMATSHPDGGILNIDVLSFSRFPRKVFEEVGQPKRIVLDDTGKCLLIKRAASKCRDDLHLLSRGMSNPSWAEEVKSVISEFMQYDISVENLDEIIEKTTDRALSLKLKDLQLLYKGFLAECENKYLTGEEMLDLLCQRIPYSKKLEGAVVIFDGFTGFTPIQVRVIMTLLEKVKDIIITFPYENLNGHSLEDEYLFELTRQNMNEIIKMVEKTNIKINDDIILLDNKRLASNEALLHLEKNLFRNGKVKPVSSNDRIKIVKCENIDEECHILCHEILGLIEKNNLRYRDIAVVCGDMSKYQRGLADNFDKYNIPYYMDSNRNINNNILSRFILSYLSVMQSMFSIEDVFSFLRTGLTDISNEDIDKLENYIYARGIDTYYKWTNEFKINSKETESKEEALAAINKTRFTLLKLFENLQTGSSFGTRSLREWISSIYEIMSKLKINDKLQEKAAELEEVGRYDEALETKGVYAKVIDLFDQLCDLMGEEELSVKELRDILEVGIGEIRVGILPQRVDSLVVGDIERTRLKDIKALLFIGVNDGNIPKESSSGGLLSILEREYLKELGNRLAPTPQDKAYIEQLYLYLNVTRPTEYLYLSYSTVGQMGEGMLKSYLISVIRDMYTDLEEIDSKNIRNINSIEDIKKEVATLMGKYVISVIDENEKKRLFEGIAILKNNEKEKDWCEKIIDNAYREYAPVKISPEVADELYGNLIKVSVSTMEKYAKCQYSYFVTSGLKLTPREVYGVEFIDTGNLNHFSIEAISNQLKENGLDFNTVKVEDIEDMIDQTVEKIVDEYDSGLFEKDATTKYYVTQLKRIIKRTVDTLGYQLSKGKFKPELFEEAFETTYKLGDEGNAKEIVINGRIDRIDVYRDGYSDNEYVKVVDYKSSVKRFKPEQLEAGVALQLALYLKKAVEIIKKEDPNKNIIPGAMLYYAVDDPIVEGAVDAQAEIRKKLVPSGAIVNDDKLIQGLDNTVKENEKSDVAPITLKKDGSLKKTNSIYSVEEFNGFMQRAEEIMFENAKNILEGNIEINPILDKSVDACSYCDLKGLCGFDSKIHGYNYRSLNGDIKSEDESEEAEDEEKGEE